jgi:hypothetical protein
MSRAPIHTSASRSSSGSVRGGVEYEFERLTISRDLTRGFVTRLLTDRAEHGGWELDRVRILADGTRKVVLRRKIIRQPRPAYAG